MNIGIIYPKDSEALFNIRSKRPYGGANVQLFQINRELLSYDDIKTVSIIPDYSDLYFPEMEKFNIEMTYKENDLFFIKALKMHRVIRKTKPDYLIQRGLSFLSCIMAFYCYFFGLKFVFMFAHDVESEGRYQKNRDKCRLFKLLIKFSYKLVVQNNIQYKNIAFQTSSDRILLFKKGLDINSAKTFTKDFAKVYDCIWIARCDEWKKPENFITLADYHKNYMFLMVTSPSIGKEKYYEDIVKEVRKRDNIKLSDFVDNSIVYQYLLKSKVFCITSDMEGDWPMVVLEAALLGVPVLSLNINYDDLIDSYQGGLFCNSDMNQFYSNLKVLIDNRDTYRKFSANAERYVYDKHNIEKNVSKLIKDIIDSKY